MSKKRAKVAGRQRDKRRLPFCYVWRKNEREREGTDIFARAGIDSSREGPSEDLSRSGPSADRQFRTRERK